MNKRSMRMLALIPSLLTGTGVLAESSALTFSGSCTAEMYGVQPETQSFSIRNNKGVKMRFRTVGVGTAVYADFSPAGKASLAWEYLIPRASNETRGETSLEAAKPGDKLGLYQITYGGNPEINCSGVVR